MYSQRMNHMKKKGYISSINILFTGFGESATRHAKMTDWCIEIKCCKEFRFGEKCSKGFRCYYSRSNHSKIKYQRKMNRSEGVKRLILTYSLTHLQFERAERKDYVFVLSFGCSPRKKVAYYDEDRLCHTHTYISAGLWKENRIFSTRIQIIDSICVAFFSSSKPLRRCSFFRSFSLLLPFHISSFICWFIFSIFFFGKKR